MTINTDNKPDFIGIGVEKAGTTWIHYNLKTHPEICMISRKKFKEIYFFNESHQYSKGIEYYRSLYNRCPKNKVKGEFTAGYLSSPQTPFLIYKHFPNVKLIVCLRNPIERAYSHYKYDMELKGFYNIYKSFEEAIKKNLSFLKLSFYYKQLKKYYDLFPNKNILVLFFEDQKKIQ